MEKIIVLPVTNVGFYEASEVIELHLKKEELIGEVYFSTSNRMDPKKASQVDFVIFANKAFSYIAEKVDYINFEEKSAPEDVHMFTPEEFSNDQDLHWFKVKNIRKTDLEELNLFDMVNKKAQQQYGGVGNYIKGTKRLQVFYGKNG